MISEQFVRRLLTGSFFDEFPEFRSLRSAVGAKKKPLGGCRRCGRGRQPGDRLLSGFTTILRSLSAVRVEELKRRANVQQLQFNGYNHIRGAYEVMTL